MNKLEMLEDLGFDNSSANDDGTVSVACSGCDAIVINGTACHERGCPNRPVECRECGSMHRDHYSAGLCCASCDEGEGGHDD